ncbi:catecholate siderophore receptor CirA [compost metagenome]
MRGEYIGPQQQAAGTAQTTLRGYWLWSLDARWRITDTVSVLAGVDNLANKRLDETGALYPYPEAGRYVHAGIELGF